jgi:hypothetical protein
LRCCPESFLKDRDRCQHARLGRSHSCTRVGKDRSID